MAGRVCPRKLGQLLSILHMREASTARSATNIVNSNELIMKVDDNPKDVEELILEKLATQDGTKKVWSTLPKPLQVPEEDADINIPLLEAHIKELCTVKELFDGKLKRTGYYGKALQPEGDVGGALEGRNLSQIVIEEADLSSRFIRSDLKHSSLDGCRIWASSFDQADMRCCTIMGSRVRNCTFVGADMEGADLTGSNFANCSFRQCNLKQAKLTSAQFAYCDFTLCDMSDSETNGETFFCRPYGWHLSRHLNFKRPITEKERCELPEGTHERERLSLGRAQVRRQEEEVEEGDEEEERMFRERRKLNEDEARAEAHEDQRLRSRQQQ